MGVPRAAEHRVSSLCDYPKPKKADLAQLICRPEKSANRSSNVERFLASSTEPVMKKVVSSAYCRIGMHPG